MKHRFYKNTIPFFALCFLGTTFAQKFDKKFTENFKVNKDVEVVINATNTEINVTTWNKNEVQVKAFIEVESLSKEDAEKYFKDWNFEALGNNKIVKITSNGNTSFNPGNDFVFFDAMNFDIQIPDIDLSNIETIALPAIDFDFDFNFPIEDLKDLEKNMKKEGKYSFNYHDGDNHIVINSKKEWKAFKKTKKYKDLKLKMLQNKVKMQFNLYESREKLKIGLAKAKLEYKKIDKEKIKKELAIAKEQLKKLNFRFFSDDIQVNGKKIKIKKRLEIKVPKNAVFSLKTRHCKVKLPNTVASGKVKYGTFNADNLIGGELFIDYSSVNIKDLNACTLFLNNVTDANIASVTNTIMSNNSSDVTIFRVNNNVTLSDKFGELTVESFNESFGEFILNLSQSNATLILGKTNSVFKYNVNKVKLDNRSATILNKNKAKNNIIKVNGDYSSIVIK